MPWLRRLIADLSPRRPEFDSWICGGHCGIGTGYFSGYCGFPVSVIPPRLHTHLHLRPARTRRIKGGSLGTYRKAMQQLDGGRPEPSNGHDRYWNTSNQGICTDAQRTAAWRLSWWCDVVRLVTGVSEKSAATTFRVEN